VLTKGVIIPIKALTEIRKLLAGADLKTCDIAFKAPHVFVKCGNATLAIKTIDAQFPPYEQVIPRGYTKLVTVDKAELIEACKRGKLLGCETRGLAISATKGALTLSSDNPDIGEVKESIDAEYEGADAQIGLNPVYLLELLAQIDGKRVTLGFDKPLDPILVRDTDDVVSRSLSESALVGVVMPMRIK
jgi:DNA polymerase-3 subunit beta